MAKTRIGFDIGCSSLKIAVTKGDNTEFHEVLLPEHMVENGEIVMPNAFPQFLRQVKKELRLPGGEGTLLIPPAHVICRLVTVPRMTEQQLLMNLPYEFSDFIQGAPEQYFCDYALCEDTNGEEAPSEMTVMAAAASKDRMYSYIRMFAQAGIRLKMLLPQEMALIGLAQSYSEYDGEAPKEICFVDLGHMSTRITVVKNDRVQAVRQVSLAMQDLDRIIADQLNVDMFLAGTYKRENYKEILEHPSCMELYRRIAVEILKVINFYQFTFRDSELPGVYLIGGGANIAPLCQSIEEALPLPLLSPSELIPYTEEMGENYYTGILAAGAAFAREEK